ncbi:ABC transporter permease [Clostridium sp. FP1]|uniref:ABC transporter permease n=1 Tax=Clostridium sp. FP1 TaxID=2724076 RepID=UPI0013E96114|nr:ABC transporter permease [Clostridium sp. FP1]MBZ9634800.1 ABC transporter permease [Clostridium sp. FP1]
MKFTQAIKMALSSVVANKMRSFLTMLGIIIGILSVIILIGMGQGTKKQVADQIQGLGTNLITVSIIGSREITVSNEEIATLKTKPGIKEIAPIINGNVTIKAGVKNTTTTVEATTPNYEEIKQIGAEAGRFINQNDLDNRYKVAVVGVDVIDAVFSNRNVVGKTMLVNGNEFTIIGVLQSKGSTSAGSNDNKIIIPITTAQRLLKNKSIKTFYVETTSADTVNDAMANLQVFMLRKSNNDSTKFRVFNQSDLLSTATASSDSMTLMLGGIAGISLLVGGIGIMNIMLVSVIERTGEIGLRKAVGARRGDILLQFLIESLVISGVGGIVGVLGSFLGAYLLGKFANMSVLISPIIIIVSFGFSAGVGVVFGLYPANKASKLRPIEALRYE